jgi:hypothetical protein
MDGEQGKSTDKESEFMGMQQKLREAQHVIAQFYQENRELKRKLAEKFSEEKNKAEPKIERSKWKEVMQSPETTILAKPTTPLTRY